MLSRPRMRQRFLMVSCLLLGVLGGRAYGAVAMLLEQPYGSFGAMNPTGHAAVYLSRVCADTPTRLRMCHAGEYGVVVSRYHRVNGYDWVAIPLIPYLYAVEQEREIPPWVDKEDVAVLRNEYRKRHLLALAPDVEEKEIPGGDWTQLVGSAFDRTIYGFELETTAEEDERLIALLNDRKNVVQFNLFFRNCADFSKMVLNTYFPHAVHRNYIADAGLTTPKQVAKSVVKYEKKHPELNGRQFVIPQVDGLVERSHDVKGVAESLIKSKKYVVPMAVLWPHFTAGVVAAYLVGGRLNMPKKAPVFDVSAAKIEGVESVQEIVVAEDGSRGPGEVMPAKMGPVVIPAAVVEEAGN
jgi:hypothetical protein